MCSAPLVPVKDVVRIAHQRGIPVLVDGAQGAVHLDVDVADIDCDFYTFRGHKLYGPSGIGVLYGKHAHLAAMPPFNGGGEMMRKVTKEAVTYADPPQKFEAGTLRSSRRSGWVPPSITSIPSVLLPSTPTRRRSCPMRQTASGRSIRSRSWATPGTRERSSHSR
jgi:hypothetical protein